MPACLAMFYQGVVSSYTQPNPSQLSFGWVPLNRADITLTIFNPNPSQSIYLTINAFDNTNFVWKTIPTPSTAIAGGASVNITLSYIGAETDNTGDATGYWSLTNGGAAEGYMSFYAEKQSNDRNPNA